MITVAVLLEGGSGGLSEEVENRVWWSRTRKKNKKDETVMVWCRKVEISRGAEAA
jgi:hypothetical protein